MRLSARWLTGLAIAIAALSAAGCGGTVVDKSKLDDTLQKSLEDSLHEKITTVDCPSDLPVDPGSTFTCEVIFSNGKRETASLKIRDKDADISLVGIKENK